MRRLSLCRERVCRDEALNSRALIALACVFCYYRLTASADSESCGRGLMVERLPSKQYVRVRFPAPAPLRVGHNELLHMNTHQTKKVFAYMALVALIATTGLHPSSASACSCIMPVPPVEALGQSDAVFLGTVTDIAPRSREYGNIVTIETQAFWKGGIEKTVEVRTAQDSAACGVFFETGKTYVVYAYQSEEDGSLGANSCSRTHEVISADQDEDIIALGEGTVPANNPEPEPAIDDEGGILVTAIVVAVAAVAGYTVSRIRIKRSQNKG